MLPDSNLVTLMIAKTHLWHLQEASNQHRVKTYLALSHVRATLVKMFKPSTEPMLGV